MGATRVRLVDDDVNLREINRMILAGAWTFSHR